MAIISSLLPTEVARTSRKHRRDDDDELEREFEKKLKLGSDSIHEGDTETGAQVGFEINPNISFDKPLTEHSHNGDILGLSGIHTDTDIANKMYQHFRDIYVGNSAIIPWYSLYWMIIYHLQIWTLRLFNRFYRKYHKRVGISNVKPFRSFGQIIDLIDLKKSNFQWSDLSQILDEENYLERRRLHKKEISRKKDRIKKLDEEDTIDHESVKYNYWDRLRNFDRDVNMFDVSEELAEKYPIDKKFEELSDLDMDIE